jgi:hypothetical protein
MTYSLKQRSAECYRRAIGTRVNLWISENGVKAALITLVA